jgi:hypothetical protein
MNVPAAFWLGTHVFDAASAKTAISPPSAARPTPGTASSAAAVRAAVSRNGRTGWHPTLPHAVPAPLAVCPGPERVAEGSPTGNAPVTPAGCTAGTVAGSSTPRWFMNEHRTCHDLKEIAV